MKSEPVVLFAAVLLAWSSSGPPAARAAEPAETARARSSVSPRRLEHQNGLDGSTGLLRSAAADSGGLGTFRISLTQTYFAGSGLLCGVCALPGGPALGGSDEISQAGTRLGISATPAEFLEAYAGLRYQSTSDSRGSPHAIQLVGDSLLGVKAFLPRGPDTLYSFGGAVDARFLSTPNGVGVDAASVGLHALGTLDFTARAREEDRLPLRVHLNFRYLFDASGKPANDTEDRRGAAIGPNRISRIERFSHDIHRVDTLRTAVGLEGVFRFVRPFAEWSLDVPINRQQHECGPTGVRSAGDGCLASAGFAGIPSRLTLGARVYPWAKDWLEGLALLAAFDVGTGATSAFIEEVAPERPWAFHIGAAWAVDTRAREKIVTLEKPAGPVAPAPVVRRHIEGTVVRAGTSEPVPGAILRFKDRQLSPIVADEHGFFRTAGLDAGTYDFSVGADGFKNGDCSTFVPETAGAAFPSASPSPAQPKPGSAAGSTPGMPASPAQASVVVNLQCTLEALPRVATVTGFVRDAETTGLLENADVTITDPLGRTLTLRTDAQGAFRFGNVLAGKSKLFVERERYLRAALEIDLEARKDTTVQVLLHARPKTPNVVLTKKELKLKKEVHFLHGSAEIQPDSAALLEEAADVLRAHPEIARVEVQGHTDNTGGADVNLRLSDARANAVRNVLVAQGVDAARLTARGYGQEKPLVANDNAKNRAKNRRVQLVIAP